MPVYEYLCQSCGLRFDALQRMTDDPLTECTSCHGPVRRVIQP
ncbi:MAG TPA: FmdB family zinc ribbon protein, partial [Chloroflexota bacterium]|nr:FmdB family zinc ribbon protein [Chloroflexota bacterium]